MDVNQFTWKRILYFLGGLMLIAFGISLTISADFGCGGWDAAHIGLVKHFGFSIGTWMNLWALTYLFIAMLLSKKRYRIECMITSLLIGIGVDFFHFLLSDLSIQQPFLKPILFILGTLIISLGAGFYLVSELPPNPTDYMMMCIKDRFSISITASKTIVEATGIFLAILLGGPVGVGTFLMILMFGPCIDYCYHLTSKWYSL